MIYKKLRRKFIVRKYNRYVKLVDADPNFVYDINIKGFIALYEELLALEQGPKELGS